MSTLEAAIKLVETNPITFAAITAVAAATAAFFKPIMRALQRALVRRIEQAWPDDSVDLDDEARVRVATKALSQSASTSFIPRSLLELAVRNHKSTPPPKG